ncbi:SMP-30/gluconolactonase/LRE family protein [Hoeflea sp. WL0058]|uniref:SMP-30/gluconolactonase/LRE family protein n=1 Tax=Flavimaribacter sediminis TaxID=2865987 RepID=A0AAE2ZLF4_9HYPH|nr:SMP-30/gluconolactonase/LRE family protein [Flavimaribacter sediminis]
MFTLDAKDFSFAGADLSRPECIVAERDGTLWVSDNRGAITRIIPDGQQQRLGRMGGKPNGMTMAGDGSFLMANIALRRFYRVSRNGEEKVFLDTIEGQPVGAANFVERDPLGRLWLSVSSRLENHLEALESDIPDGYVILLDEKGPRIVADGLLFTNEVRLDAEMGWLYMAETRGGRVSRAPVLDDGSLGPREIFGPEPIFDGALIDGIRFDMDGNLWVTEITRNRLYMIAPNGTAHMVFEDPSSEILDHPSSLTFAGHDLRTVYVGGLGQTRLATFRAPVAGLPPAHWV